MEWDNSNPTCCSARNNISTHHADLAPLSLEVLGSDDGLTRWSQSATTSRVLREE